MSIWQAQNQDQSFRPLPRHLDGADTLPTWGEILAELKALQEQGNKVPFDTVRRKYLNLLHEHTKRNAIIYMVQWTQPANIPPDLINITEEDVQGLMEVIHGLTGSELDLIVHSPGGSAESVEGIVNYLRTKFDHIRVIVPQAAMSAATMLACAADVLMMGKHSSIGPIDPQIRINTQYGPQVVPAQAVLDQFEMARKECQDPKQLGAWIPILGQYGPALVVQCQNALELSQQLVSEWLESYMFKDKQDAKEKASKVAGILADHQRFKSHGRHIDREEAREFGLTIVNLEEDQKLQDMILSVFHSTTHTFNGTGAVKIIENHMGKAFIKQHGMVVVEQKPPPKK